MENKDIETIRRFFQAFARSSIVVQKYGVEQWGLPMIQGHILSALNRHSELTVNQVAGLLHIDKGFISRHVEQLVRSNLIERRVDSQDRRYVRLSLTEAGQQKCGQITQFMQNYICMLMERIPAEKHSLVTESLDLLSKSLQRYHEERGELV